jgi:hydrogenase maturation protease
VTSWLVPSSAGHLAERDLALPPPALVLGFGNVLLSDDGAGVQIVERLREELGTEAADFIDAGTLSFSLLPYIEATKSLLVIDAADIERPPGSIGLFEAAAMDTFLSSARRRTVHEVGLIDLLDMARLRDCLPHRRAAFPAGRRRSTRGRPTSSGAARAVEGLMSRLAGIPIRFEGPALAEGQALAEGPAPSARSGASGGLGDGVAAILTEIVNLLERLARGQTPAAIDLRSLPMSPQDRTELQRVLGEGEVTATVAAEGVSIIRETRVCGLWWVEHRDSRGDLIAELLEVAQVPEILVTASDEIAASARTLRERMRNR